MHSFKVTNNVLSDFGFCGNQINLNQLVKFYLLHYTCGKLTLSQNKAKPL